MVKRGLQYGAERRKELAKRLAKEEQVWESFKHEWPEEAQFLEEVREASEDFQREIAYALPDQMDDLFSFVSAGEIQVDVWPFAALPGEEPLKKQFHSNGINGGNSK